jgi:multidrug transporter EmrE-like cation transporter
MKIMAYLLLVIAFTLNAVASILLKVSAEYDIGFKNLWSAETITGNPYLITALFIFASNVLFYYLALRTMPLSIAYPIMVTGTFLLVGLSAVLIFHESLNVFQLVGYVLVISGIVLVSLFTV